MISLDGSYLEGGGQIIRTALALSAITQKSFEMTNIRKNRPSPGLKNQHLTCIKAFKHICDPEVVGAELGSTSVKFYPRKLKPSRFSIDIGTAGSITLLLQSILPIVAFKKISINITGGTDVRWAMPIDYLSNVLTPQLQRYADINIKLLKRGYYPKGGGLVEFRSKPKERPKIIDLIKQGTLIQIKGISHASTDLPNVAERQAKAARLSLSKLEVPVHIQTQYIDTMSTGSGITLWAIFAKDDEVSTFNPVKLGADFLGEKGLRAEQVGTSAAELLKKEISSDAPVDTHLADNLVPFLAMFGGRYKASSISNHTLTNIYVCKKFLSEIKTEASTVLSQGFFHDSAKAL